MDTWLKAALCRLNHPLTENSDMADEIIHRLRGVLLETNYSGLIRANEIFQEWLTGHVSMPLGKDGEHITINLIDFNQYERMLSVNRYSLLVHVIVFSTWCYL